MKTTPIYGIPYLEGNDLVSAAPEQFAKMANGVETALNEVDNRNTPEGVKPVIATTLETLAGLKGTTGQTGYVTADPTESNNGPYYWNGSAWLPYATSAMLDTLKNQLTQDYRSAKFKMQNTGSFAPDLYGGANEILVNPTLGLIHVNLTGFRSTVTVGNYPVFLYSSGVKPSAPVPLGCLWAIQSGNFGKQATWGTDGNITVIGSLTNGDRCIHTPCTLPIPAGVTFS
ncbi:hypothetical protein [Bifidobacterium imperatoris]|uniref:Uncharacterized protein n=1 Tax=Bifidobacterium imperatoris TaxID=2020965 RepID=A0A2N5IQU5_9BIFI|nr:hypothetical protein [Bifidobacterium imperatoris]PLS24335.1 hypothetical protein Tam1G_1598 [Bifidobacterium imperatoris]